MNIIKNGPAEPLLRRSAWLSYGPVGVLLWAFKLFSPHVWLFLAWDVSRLLVVFPCVHFILHLLQSKEPGRGRHAAVVNTYTLVPPLNKQ
jgi:hypothetical protein